MTYQDPYDNPLHYRETSGCLQAVSTVLAFIVLAFICIWLSACSTTKTVTQAETRDSIRVEHRLDSVYIFQHDSIFRDRWREGDTVYVTTVKWQVKWQDRLVAVHDTVTSVQTEQIAVPYVPTYYQWCSRIVWILAALIALRLAIWIAKKYYLHK